MREYTDCYVAFMDLLGFKAILGDKNMSCEKIAQIFDEIKKQYYVRDNEAPMVNPDDIHFRVMSDSVCIYINSAIEDSLLVLIFLCTFFQVRLLRLSSPILVRGGISKGNMYSNGDILFKNTTVEINECTFTSNSGNMGVIYADASSELSVVCSRFNSNTASYYGGAIYFEYKCTVTNCNFTNNYAFDGGAIRFKGEGTLTNCMFVNNAAHDGGAIYFEINCLKKR